MKQLLLFFIFMTTAIQAYSQTSTLFFSEYIEGGGYNKYLEIYNGTGSSVDLSSYVINLYSNGSSEPSSSLALSGTLASGSVYVIANSQGTAYTGTADLTNDQITAYNGDDAVALLTSAGDYVDIIGCIGERDNWTDGDYSTKDHTIIRKSSVTSGVSSNPSTGFPTLTTEWDVYDKDNASYLGSYPITTTDVATPASIEELKVYPNPFSSFISVEASNIKNIRLTNITGEVVKFVNTEETDIETISTSDLADGIYIIKITLEDGSSSIKKLIKK